MSRFTRLGLILGLLLAVAAPAGATHTPPGEEFTPEYVEKAVYLHCNGSLKASNVHTIADGNMVSWDENKPTASYQSGAGCGTMDTFLTGTTNQNPIYDFPMQGTFTGNIDNLTIRLYGIDLSASRALNEWTVDLHLTIDGVDILTRPTVVHRAIPDANTSGARLYEVTVTGIGLATEADHENEHSVQLTVYPKFVNGSGVVAWVYDAAEIDSGLVFNDTTPSNVTVARNTEIPAEETTEEESGFAHWSL